METMTMTPEQIENVRAQADPPATAGVDATMGPESANAAAVRGVADRIIDLCRKSRDENTATALAIGELCEEAIILNAENHPTLPRHGKGGIVPQTLTIIRDRMATDAPWALRSGHPTEYRRAYHLRDQLGDDAAPIGRISFDVIRTLASTLHHDENADTFAFKAAVDVNGTAYPADYRTWVADSVAELADTPMSATAVRKALRKWESDLRESLMSAKDRKKLEAKRDADAEKERDAKRSAFLADLPVKLAELNIPNATFERALIDKQIIGERDVIVEEGATAPITDPALMSLDDLAEFVRLLLTSEDDTRIGAIWRPMKDYMVARQQMAKRAGPPRPPLDDSPAVNKAARAA